MATDQKPDLVDVDSLEEKFSELESRLQSQMKMMEEEIGRFQENMETYKKLLSLNSDEKSTDIEDNPYSSVTDWPSPLESCAMEDFSEGNNLNVRFDVKDYSADQVSINIIDDALIVHAKSDETDKEFRYQVTLPKDTKLEQLKRSWFGNGILAIQGVLPSPLRP